MVKRRLPKLPSHYEDVGYDYPGLPLEEVAGDKDRTVTRVHSRYDESIDDQHKINHSDAATGEHAIFINSNAESASMKPYADLNREKLTNNLHLEKSNCNPEEVIYNLQQVSKEMNDYLELDSKESNQYMDIDPQKMTQNIDLGTKAEYQTLDLGRKEVSQTFELGSKEVNQNMDVGTKELKETIDLSPKEVNETRKSGRDVGSKELNKTVDI